MAVADLHAESLLTIKEQNQFMVVAHRFFKHKLAVVALVIIALFVVIAVLAPVIAPYDPYKQNLAPAYSSPFRGTSPRRG